MTIIAAYEGVHHYWIGSDSMGSDNRIQVDLGKKLIRKGKYQIGFTWSYRIADIIRESKNFPDDIISIRGARNFRDILIEELKIQTGIKEDTDSGDLMEVPLGLIIISSSGMYVIESDFQLHKIKNGYYAAGSGQEFAFGALYTAQQQRLSGKEAIKFAINSAILHSTSCGGKCHIKSIPKR